MVIHYLRIASFTNHKHKLKIHHYYDHNTEKFKDFAAINTQYFITRQISYKSIQSAIDIW